MLPLFLTSNGLYEDDVFIELLKVIKDHKIQKKICFITTAIRKSDRAFHQDKTKNLFNKAGFKIVDFIDIEVDDPSKLREYPIVCIFGGDPFFLLGQLRGNGAIEIIRELREKGHFIVGHSSGAAVLGKSISHAQLLHPEWNTINLVDLEGIGLIDGVILPHSNRYTKSEGLIKEYLEKNQYNIIRINDYKYEIV
ncbi:Type 1 glutamine amidotransferase-like domain-containing protein [Halalkalibacter urbisdiaboli]|uniref:Type 1 glutamine amidotransferase-like domain-containing protein n=1 Tax=Halalkalibacter urbisdiaboli TaxID=1960589 RepID=UPI000B438F46|nr:Type 1 glutamine amidotransferase-like domain-containing protein [Halalkalibacter urbisdiaboli]